MPLPREGVAIVALPAIAALLPIVARARQWRGRDTGKDRRGPLPTRDRAHRILAAIAAKRAADGEAAEGKGRAMTTATTPTFGRGRPRPADERPLDGRHGAVRRGGEAPAVERVQFTGTASEFFGIWIVNILLSVLTLGIYSAWAKVRTRRWFAGHTRLLGHGFDYHADPRRILVGRIIALVALVALNAMGQIDERLALVALLAYAVLVPWAIVRGLSFNANMTSYRNVRLGFDGTTWHAFKAYILWPIASVLTLGILVPYGSRSRARFMGRHRYGRAEFFADPSVGGFYAALGRTVLPLIGLLVAVAVVAAALASGASGADAAVEAMAGAAVGLVMVLAPLTYAAFLLVPVFYRALSRNHTFDSLSLAGRRVFASDLSPWRMAWIALSNIVVVVLTLGLMTPWAMVRTARYKAAHTHVLDRPEYWDRFVAAEVDRSGVASGEFLDLDGGFDFGV